MSKHINRYRLVHEIAEDARRTDILEREKQTKDKDKEISFHFVPERKNTVKESYYKILKEKYNKNS